MDKSKNSENAGMKKVDELISGALSNLKQMIDSNTIIGKPIEVGSDMLILPISKVSMGFVSGGGELAVENVKKASFPFSGGTGSGFNILPVGFLCVSGGKVEFLSAETGTSYNKVLDTMLVMLNKILVEGRDDEKI